MRIALFSDRYLPDTDGVTTSIESFRAELEKLGNEVYIVAPAAGLRLKETTPHVIRFRAVKGLFFEDYSTSFFFPPQTMRQLDKLKLDLVHYHTPGVVGLFGAYYAIRNNIPLVTTYHTDLYEYVTHYPGVLPGTIALSMMAPLLTGGGMSEYRTGLSAIKPERSIDRWNQKIVERSVTMVHNHCDLVIAPSEKMAIQLRDWKTTSPLRILPTGIDEIITTKSEIKAAKATYGISETDRVILFVGRISTEKNLELLLKSFVLLSGKDEHAKLMFVGDGTALNNLKSQAIELGVSDKVIFSGWINRDQLGAIYKMAHVFAFPSLADTQGLVVNEAALANVPSVMIDPHVSDVMRDHVTGLYARPNIKDFAAKIATLLNDDELRIKLGKAARVRALLYSAEGQARQLVQMYDDAIATHASNQMKSKKK